MNHRLSCFESLMAQFPEPAHHTLRNHLARGGLLTSDQAGQLAGILGAGSEELMIRLLPMARCYAVAPISDYRVGAVAAAFLDESTRHPALFLGANMEFPGLALNYTLHAEQSAVMNAWHHGAKRISTIAVTAEPCGYCRQFLFELKERRQLTVIIRKKSQPGATLLLSNLLPMAFDPVAYDLTPGLLADPDSGEALYVAGADDDPLLSRALAAAGASYAPYTGNYAGCAVETGNNAVFTGRYAESAAFNPSVSPVQSALCMMNMALPDKPQKIHRAILVERPVKIHQKTAAEALIRSIAPDVRLEYFEAVVRRFGE